MYLRDVHIIYYINFLYKRVTFVYLYIDMHTERCTCVATNVHGIYFFICIFYLC